MNWFGGTQDAIIALFVEDESFAAAILAWLAGGAICLRFFHLPPAAEGVLLVVGLVVLLAENIDRTSREYRP